MPNRHLELDQTKSLLDVVFGVVIGLALVELPERGWDLLGSPDAESTVPVLLLISGLVFASFYWVETRFFLSFQEQFDSVVQKDKIQRTDGVRLPLATFLLGTLAMMATAAGVLAAAVRGSYRGFLAASLLYWVLELVGTYFLKRQYLPFEATIAGGRREHEDEFDWFLLHMKSQFFYCYGLANAAFFAILLAFDRWFVSTTELRALLSLAILVATLVRHLFVRSAGADLWLGRIAHKYSVPADIV